MSADIGFGRGISDEILQHVYSTYIPVYLFGAQNQIGRYREFARLKEINTLQGLFGCIHEASTLFEDLDCLKRYLKFANIDVDGYQPQWTNARHHMRHDLREELATSEKNKRARSRKFGIKPNLHAELRCEYEYVQIGTTRIMLSEIEGYLERTAQALYFSYEEAEKKGILNKNPLVWDKSG